MDSQLVPSTSLRPITERFLMVNTSIPVFIDNQGKRYLNKLWVKDLVEHFKYIKNFTLASPCFHGEPPSDTVCIDDNSAFENVHFIDLPACRNVAQYIRSLPQTIPQLWRAVQENDIIQSGVAGQPVPEVLLLTPMVRFSQKTYFLFVESAFWRLVPGTKSSIKQKIRAYITEAISRWCLNYADIAVFTQDSYRQSLMPNRLDRGHVIHASWIDEPNIISDDEAIALWQEKLASYNGELRLLFAARLIPVKGVYVLLDAVKTLAQRGIPIHLDILGEGDLFEVCQQACQQDLAPVTIRMLGTVPYETEFFHTLRKYHAIVVPSLSDEQPRIVYDTYSQAIPVLASSTDGLRNCVEDGKTGKLVPPNNASALADLIAWAASHPEDLSRLGLSALPVAHSLTHQEMHRKRWKLLLDLLAYDKS